MKIVLGGAQFGMKYGLFNSEKIKKKEFSKIEKLILKSNIDFIDTASTYRNSEKIIGQSRLNKLKIISKIKISPNNRGNIKNSVNKIVFQSLKRLKTKNIYGLLVHDYKDLLGARGVEFLKELKALKAKKIVKKIGISIYSPNELEKIWKFWKPDLVQTPFNLLDQRILNSGWIDILKKHNVKIFVRSCFLQGLLVGNYNSLIISKKFKTLLKNFDNWCEHNEISRLKACLDFVRQFKKIDFVIVGFNNYPQIKEILDVVKKKKFIVPKKFLVNNLNYIDPRRWN